MDIRTNIIGTDQLLDNARKNPWKDTISEREPDALNQRAIEMLLRPSGVSKEELGHVSVQDLAQMVTSARSVSNEDLQKLSTLNSPTEGHRKSAAILFSDSAAISTEPEQAVNRMAAAILQNENLASILKNEHVAWLKSEGSNTIALGSGVIASFAAYYATVAKTSIFSEISKIYHPFARGTAGFLTGAVIGGLTNNLVKKEDLLSAKGFGENLGCFAVSFGLSKSFHWGLEYELAKSFGSSKAPLYGFDALYGGAVLSGSALRLRDAKNAAVEYENLYEQARTRAQSFRTF